MVHTYTVKGPRRYRYYVCVQAQQRGWANCETKSVSAPAIEAAVVQQIRKIGSDPRIVREALKKTETQRRGRITDLTLERELAQKELAGCAAEIRGLASMVGRQDQTVTDRMADLQERIGRTQARRGQVIRELEIGRAAWRGRGEILGGAGSL